MFLRLYIFGQNMPPSKATLPFKSLSTTQSFITLSPSPPLLHETRTGLIFLKMIRKWMAWRAPPPKRKLYHRFPKNNQVVRWCHRVLGRDSLHLPGAAVPHVFGAGTTPPASSSWPLHTPHCSGPENHGHRAECLFRCTWMW